MLKSFKIYTCTNGSLGLHLSRAPWDPYPWVSSIQKDSTSYQAGVRIGDCLLELNGQDVLGMKISEIAALLKNHWLNESSNYVTVVIWRNKCNTNNNNNSENATTNNCNKSFTANGDDEDDDDDDYGDEDEENNAHNINQQSLQKFANCLQHIAQLLECPVCLEVIKPPGWQCCNGHVLCNNCRSRSEKCPVCRVPLGPRGRCLLSDKLFTLLADSFPCDGVRSNKNSPKDRRKCSTDFHSQPKMAIVQKQPLLQQQEKDEQQGVKKAKDFLLTSLRRHTRKISNYKTNHDDDMEHSLAGETKGENKHPSMQKQAMHDIHDGVIVRSNSKRNSSHRKSSAEHNSEAASIIEQRTNNANRRSVATTFCYNELQGQISTIQQCHCVTCFKSDGVAAVNNPTTAATTATTQSPAVNKYILRIPSQGQLGENIVKQQERNEEKYQTYQCPTGKLCCLNLNVMPHATCTSTSRGTFLVTTNNNDATTTNTPFCEPMTNNNLSERMTTTTAAAKQANTTLTQTALMTGQQHQLQHHQVNAFKFYKILKNEWDILTHLTEDHKLPVNQYYAEYGQRIRVPCLGQQQSITCLNLRGSDENEAKVEKFFIACIPVQQQPTAVTKTTTATTPSLKVAIFLYHLNALAHDTTTPTSTTTTTTCLTDEASSFETIIENPITGIKWFGRAHPLTLTWSQIYEKQHFLWHSVLPHNLLAVRMNDRTLNTTDDDDDDALVIVVKRNSAIKTNN